MDKNQNKHVNPLTLTMLIVVFISFLFSSCELIEGIFKTGMGVGIFIVIAVIAVIVLVISKLGKK